MQNQKQSEKRFLLPSFVLFLLWFVLRLSSILTSPSLCLLLLCLCLFVSWMAPPKFTYVSLNPLSSDAWNGRCGAPCFGSQAPRGQNFRLPRPSPQVYTHTLGAPLVCSFASFVRSFKIPVYCDTPPRLTQKSSVKEGPCPPSGQSLLIADVSHHMHQQRPTSITSPYHLCSRPAHNRAATGAGAARFCSSLP